MQMGERVWGQRLKNIYFNRAFGGRSMGLRNFILKRLVYSFVLILLVILLNFVIFKGMPGDPVQFLLHPWGRESAEVRMQQEQNLRELWGFGEPFEVQAVKYIRNLLMWNFGTSYIERRPVTESLGIRLPYTLVLLGGSAVLSILLGVIIGIMVIQKRGSVVDSGVVTGSLVLGSLPTFWLGLVFLLLFYNILRWFPNKGAFPDAWAFGWPVPFTVSSSYTSTSLSSVFSLNIMSAWTFVAGYLRHLFLPMLTLTVFSIGGWILLTRATMLDAITEDYIVTARAKGLTERAVLFRHALKNASLPIITSAALSFGFILSGAIITETVFTYPGLGAWTWTAIQFLDYTVLMAVFYIVSICVIVANVVADLLYGIIDPRIKYG
jgi:peptide/nickel transport system permease protein